MTNMIPHSRPWLGDAEKNAVAAVVASGMLLGGGKVAEFRANLAARVGKSTFMFSSGRQSIFAGLCALNLPRNSEVVVQTYVCGAVDEAIRAAGLVPRYCDIADRWAASVETVADAFNQRCRAIILASPFGLSQTAEPFRKFGVPILNDLCQAAPDVMAVEDAADFGDIAAMSFHPTKYLCAGLGAAIDLTGRYSEHLAKQEAHCAERFPIYDTQAAMGIAQLLRLEEISARRRSIFERYTFALSSSRLKHLLKVGATQSGQLLRFPLWLERGDINEIFDAFLKRDIIVRSGVDSLAHRIHGAADNNFRASVRALEHTISVPFYPALLNNQVEIVSRSLELVS